MSLADERARATVHCPWCGDAVPGRDVGDAPVAEVDDGYLRQHLAEAHR